MRDSILTLKEKIISVDDMLLFDGNVSDKPPTDDEQSIEQFVLSSKQTTYFKLGQIFIA
jgi:hypothetical protein